MSFKRVDNSSGSVEDKLEKCRKFQAKVLVEKIKFCQRVDSYIPNNWDFNRNPLPNTILYYSSTYKTRNSNDPKDELLAALEQNTEMISPLNNRVHKGIWFITRPGTVLLMYGSEEKVFTEVMIVRARAYKGVPHFVEGQLVGKLDPETIMKTTLEYDREYGLYLKKIYDKQIKPISVSKNIVDDIVNDKSVMVGMGLIRSGR